MMLLSMARFRRFFFLVLMAVIFPCQVWAEEVNASQMPSLFSSMKNKMAYIGERQTVLSKNIANANTPEYKARDLKPYSNKAIESQQHRLQMRATNPGHFAGNRSGSGRFRTIKEKNAFETTIAGNNVSLDEEMRKVAENNLEYQEITNLYKKWSGVMRTAVTGGRQ